MDNPKTSETLGTQVGVIKNGQTRDIGNIGHTSRGNQEWTIQRTSETLGTQVGVIKNGQSRDIGNIGHTSRGNQEWTIQRHRKHWAHK